MEEGQNTKIAIVNPDKCKPKKCGQQCKKTCPINKQGQRCIDVTPTSKISFIAENLCIGCGLCIKRCPYEAIKIINLPSNLNKDVTHRYGPNSFKLHRLPLPRAGEVLGLVGSNGIGKSTALKILAGKVTPNLGEYSEDPKWDKIIKYYRGSQHQGYFTKLLEENLKATQKPQYVDIIGKKLEHKVGPFLKRKDKKGIAEKLIEDLELQNVLERKICDLSGGELQRFVCALVAVDNADIYMYDEPTSYLDVKQRLQVSRVIRNLLAFDKYVIVVEHDLSILDYLSDYICMLYGMPGVYGVVTKPSGVREGINIFLSGFIPTENMRFRDYSLNFRVADTADSSAIDEDGEQEKKEPVDKKGKKEEKKKEEKKKDDKKKEQEVEEMTAEMKKKQEEKKKAEKQQKFQEIKKKEAEENKEDAYYKQYKYPTMKLTYGESFALNVEKGGFNDSQIMVLMGQNGTGKSTLIELLAGRKQPDELEFELPVLGISYKPQKITPKFTGTVRELFTKTLGERWKNPRFQSEVFKPMDIEILLDHGVQTLSGGELQRVAIVKALCQPAQVYLIDEPSAYLDSEQRIIAAKVMKRYIINSKKSGFIVEHDFIMASYLADRVIVFEGIPGKECRAHRPEGLVTGMNRFLEMMEITFRRDPTNFRPRINKMDSLKDKEQKASGQYFLLEE